MIFGQTPGKAPVPVAKLPTPTAAASAAAAPQAPLEIRNSFQRPSMAPRMPRARWQSHLQPFANMAPMRMRSPVQMPEMPNVMKPNTNIIQQGNTVPQPGFSGGFGAPGFGANSLGFVPNQNDIRAKLALMQQGSRPDTQGVVQPGIPQGAMQKRIGMTVPTIPGLGEFGASASPYMTMRTGAFPSLRVNNMRADVNQVEQIVRGLNPVVGG